jgi:RNA polymerase sigma-70 factor (ECF subfamily)
MVHAILLGRVPRRDVDDLVQEVFLTVYTRIRELREPGAFGGWIATIARNRATDHLRQSREQVELPDELPGGDPIDTETFAVLAIVRALPEAYRDTLLMRLVEGMSGNEIAERSGLTPASVRVNLHRGMKLLRELERKRRGQGRRLPVDPSGAGSESNGRQMLGRCGRRRAGAGCLVFHSTRLRDRESTHHRTWRTARFGGAPCGWTGAFAAARDRPDGRSTWRTGAHLR